MSDELSPTKRGKFAAKLLSCDVDLLGNPYYAKSARQLLRPKPDSACISIGTDNLNESPQNNKQYEGFEFRPDTCVDA